MKIMLIMVLAMTMARLWWYTSVMVMILMIVMVMAIVVYKANFDDEKGGCNIVVNEVTMMARSCNKFVGGLCDDAS